eukprot:359300_1
MSYIMALRLLLLRHLLHSTFSADTWENNYQLNIAYFYHSSCISFTKSNAESICSVHGADGVASIPTKAHWIFLKSIVTTEPTGSCYAHSGHKFIGIGASAIAPCSESQKLDSYTWWNNDTYNSSFFVPNYDGKIFDCSEEMALHFTHDDKEMDDADFGADFALICYKNIAPNLTTSVPTTTNSTTNPTSLPTGNPSTYPTTNPTTNPTSLPTGNPSTYPTTNPTTNPTSL